MNILNNVAGCIIIILLLLSIYSILKYDSKARQNLEILGLLSLISYHDSNKKSNKKGFNNNNK